MPKLTVEGADQLRKLAVQLSTADIKIRRELGKSLRPSVKAITSEVQNTIRSAPSHGRRGLAHNRRAARSLARAKHISDYRAREIALKTGAMTADVAAKSRAKQGAKAVAGSGLRETIAKAISGAISTGSTVTGVSITWKAAAAKMPNSQRLMPKNFNKAKGWRHPVFGDRETWVQQQGFPYFDNVITRHKDELGQKVVDGMKSAAEAILNEKG